MKKIAVLFAGILCITLMGKNISDKKMYRVEHDGDNYFAEK